MKLSRSNQIRKIELDEGSDVKNLLKKLELKPDTLIVMRKDKPIPIDDELSNGQEITIIQVSSGG